MTTTLMWHAPGLLSFLFVPVLFEVYQRMHFLKRDPLIAFAAPALWPALIVAPPNAIRKWALGLAWSLATLAAAGPYLLREDATNPESSVSDVVFVLDISPSMDARDTPPSRLQRAKWLIERISAQRPHNRFALVAYSANAYPVVPFTQDLTVLNHFTQALRTDLIQQSGSNLARALERAAALVEFDEASTLIVLSDGETHTPGVDRAADVLHARGIPVITITVGTPQGAPIIATDGSLLHYRGELVVSRAHAAALTAIANRTNGIAITESNDQTADINAVLTRVDDTARHRLSKSSMDRIELFPWLLIPSLIITSIWLVRARVLAFATVFAIMTPPFPAHASPWAEEQALYALQQGQWERATTLYNELGEFVGKMGQGAIAFRQGQWTEAATAFNDAVALARQPTEQAQALYNAGNAYARAGQLDQARVAYQRALGVQPNFSRATHNLNLVTEAENRPPPISEGDSLNEGNHLTQPASMPDGFTASDETFTSHNSDVAVTELDRENTSLLLQRRFLQRDALDRVGRNEDKPW